MLIVAIFAIIAIFRQAKFATFAIGSFAGFAKSPAMDDPQYELKRWLAEKVAPHGTISRLSAATGISNDKITRSKELESTDPKKRRQIPPHEIRAIAEFFGEVPPGFDWVLSRSTDVQYSNPPSDAGQRVGFSDQPAPGGSRDLPNLGTAVGGGSSDGDFRLNGEVTELVARPPALVGRKKAFCVTMQNTSMHPVYKEGRRVYVDPDGLRPVNGDDVLIEMYPDEDGQPGASYVKTLVARGPKEIVVSQYNPPPETLRFEAARVKQILRVIPYDELLGI